MNDAELICLNPAGFHRIHYTEWGAPDHPHVVICVHGLTRNCRDFDALAVALAGDCRVVCVNIAGRGRSDWLPDPSDYGYPQYMNDMTALIARVSAGGACAIDWVGTSMGGMLGMLMAALPGSPIRRLVLNDVGAMIPRAALARIARYAGDDPRFDRFEDFEAHLRRVAAPFGPLSDAQWRHLAEHNARRHADGRWGVVYDPAIGQPLARSPAQDVVLWTTYDAIRCPTLLLRGATSDLLLRETAEEMTRRGPKAALVEFPGVGHAPALMADDQIAAVCDFLHQR